MSESPRVDLTLSYTLLSSGQYEGCAILCEGGEHGSWEETTCVGDRAAWVRFAVEAIKVGNGGVAVLLPRSDGTKTRYLFDQRTVSRIRDETLGVEDLIL